AGVRDSAGDEHAAVVEQRRGVAAAADLQLRGGAPRILLRVEEVAGGELDEAFAAADHEHAPVEQLRRGVAVAGRRHGAGGAELAGEERRGCGGEEKTANHSASPLPWRGEGQGEGRSGRLSRGRSV